MSALRNGDIVQLRAVVTAVRPFGKDQQVMARLLPSGETVGWLLPHEAAFEVVKQPIAVGDKVKFKNSPDNDQFEVLCCFEHNQIAVRRESSTTVQITSPNRVERV